MKILGYLFLFDVLRQSRYELKKGRAKAGKESFNLTGILEIYAIFGYDERISVTDENYFHRGKRTYSP